MTGPNPPRSGRVGPELHVAPIRQGHVGTVRVQGSWAPSIHLSAAAGRADPGRSGCRAAGVAAFLRGQQPLSRVSAGVGDIAARRRAPAGT